MMKNKDLYVVAWRNAYTGDVSYGETERPRAEVEDLCKWLNEVWPNLHHWPVRASEVPKKVT